MRFPFKERRLVNHFTVGADPEFVFTNMYGQQYYHAQKFLEAGGDGPFGADGSGRQAELRAWPSRSVLEVVASLAEALQGLYNCVPQVRQYTWQATATHGNDGCGGHVHFGRKRPQREKEISALDRMAQTLLLSGLLDYEGQSVRVGRTGYGKFGDWREQAYGYEYRTLPTWLNTPEQAFLSITAMKLAVLEPRRLEQRGVLDVPSAPQMFQAFAGRDNDAAIAYQMVQRLKAMPGTLDMRSSWCIHEGLHGISARMAPSPETVAELGEALWKGRPFNGSQRSPEPLAAVPRRFDIRDGGSQETYIHRRFWNLVNELWRQSWARAMAQARVPRPWKVVDQLPCDVAWGLVSTAAGVLLPPVNNRRQMRHWERAFLKPVQFELLGENYVRNSGNQAL